MLRKSQIFSFLFSFVATFVVGFFIWNTFINSDNNIFNQVLGLSSQILRGKTWEDEANEIGLKFFPAALSPDSGIKNIVPATVFKQSEAINQDSAPETNLTDTETETLNPALMTDEEKQDLLDNIQEKLDIISQQVQALVAQQNQNNKPDELDKDKKTDNDKEGDLKDADLKDYEKIGETTVCTGQININTASQENLEKITYVGPVTAQKIIEARPFYSLNDLLKVNGIKEITLQKIIEQGCAYVESALNGGGGGGGGNVCSTTPDKNILISEVQTDSVVGTGGTNDDWVELYNPNDTRVSLAGWSLQKHSSDIVHESCSLDISFEKINFDNSATIPAKGYFLVVRNNAAQNLLDLADMKSSYLQLSDNNTVYLVRSQNKITGGDDSNIIDKVGFGLACYPENLPAQNPLDAGSIGRKWDEVNQTYFDKNNNNSDFEADKPTPKTPNTVFVPPDTIAPVITLTGAPEITINVSDVYVDAGATALDDVDGDITAKIAVVNPVDINTIGDHTVAYNVFDAAGNHAVEVTRLVHIVAAPIVSSDATVTSVIYAVSSLTDGAGTITNVPFGTPKATFLNNLIFAAGAIKNTTSSSLGDPIISNDTLVVTAQDGITIAIYTVIVNPVVILPIITSYTFNGAAQNINVNPTANPVKIDLTANENVDWVRITIENKNSPSNNKYFQPRSSCDGKASCEETWNGLMSEGTLVDGDYQIKVHIKDAAANEFNDYIAPYTITVDTATP